MKNKMTFFITGGAGFLGINLVRFLLKKGHSIVSYDIADFDYPEKETFGIKRGWKKQCRVVIW